MVRGDSGRLVLEITPADKQLLYAALDAEGITLKEWFLRCLRTYIEKELQPSLFDAAPENSELEK